MSDLLSSFWSKSGKKNAGGDSLERSESESPPASRPAAGGPPAGDPDSVPQPPTATPETVERETAQPAEPEIEVDRGVGIEPGDPAAESEFWDSDWDTPYQAIREEQKETVEDDEPAPLPPNLKARRRGTLSKRPPRQGPNLSAEQKLLLLDIWQRSGLPAGDFGALVNLSRHTLYAWKRRFELLGPAGLMKQVRGVKPGSRLPDLTKRTILMLKTAHPDWGCQRISDMLTRGPALPASPAAVARVLHEAGYQMQEQTTRPHPPQVRSFERARPNQLWQTDLFTFVLSEANRLAVVILEVLAGVCTPAEAAAALKLSLPRYYILEKRALDGLVAACEPKPLGKQPSPETRITALEKALKRAERQCARQEALVRAARRSVGLSVASAPSQPASGKRDRRGRKARRATVRALKAAETLRTRLASKEAEGVEPGALGQPAVTKEGGRTEETPASS